MLMKISQLASTDRLMKLLQHTKRRRQELILLFASLTVTPYGTLMLIAQEVWVSVK
jgi:hypothetical protein